MMDDRDDTEDELDDESADDSDDEEEEEDGREADPNEERVWIEFRQKGTKGPPTARGRRGRVCLEGHVTMAVVAHLKQLDIGQDAALCEALSIWITRDHQKWEQVKSSGVAPQMAKEQISRAELEYERDMQALQARLTGVKNDQAKADARLEFTEQRIALAESSLRRVEQDLELARASLEAERKRCDDEREFLKQERQLRLQERQTMIQQDAAERQARIEQDAAERQARQEATNRTISDINAVVSVSAEQVKNTIATHGEVVGALKSNLTEEMESSAALVRQEKVLQGLVQAQKMNSVQAATELKEQMEQVPKEKEGKQQVPWMDMLDKVISTAAPIATAIINRKPIGG